MNLQPVTESVVRLILVFCLVFLSLPAQAILDEDYLMIKTYFAHQEKWPNKKPTMEAFAKLRLKANPDIFQCYTDQDQKITREYWATGFVPWSIGLAHEIRDGIMGGRRPQAAYLISANGIQYAYADGSHVTYRIGKGGVFSILASNKDYDPGDFGAIPEMPQPKSSASASAPTP